MSPELPIPVPPVSVLSVLSMFGFRARRREDGPQSGPVILIKVTGPDVTNSGKCRMSTTQTVQAPAPWTEQLLKKTKFVFESLTPHGLTIP